MAIGHQRCATRAKLAGMTPMPTSHICPATKTGPRSTGF